MKIISIIIVVLVLINFLVQLGFILRYYIPLINQYFQNKKITWNPNYDRIIAISFLSFFCLNIYLTQILLTTSNKLLLTILYMTILIISTILIYFIERKGYLQRAKSSLSSSIKSNPKVNENKDFENKYSKIEIENIFSRLIDNDYINIINEDVNILDKNLFVKTLSEGILPDIPLFKLNMNNIQTQVFFSLFTEKNNNLTLEKFLKIFKNNNEKASAESINVSICKTTKKNKEKLFKDMEQKIFKG